MRNIVKKILNIFNNKKEVPFNDIYTVCRSASNELSEYCRLEGLNR